MSAHASQADGTLYRFGRFAVDRTSTEANFYASHPAWHKQSHPSGKGGEKPVWHIPVNKWEWCWPTGGM